MEGRVSDQGIKKGRRGRSFVAGVHAPLRSKSVGWLLVIPAAVLLLLLFYIPVGSVLVEGFRPVGATHGLSLARIHELITDPYILHLIKFTTKQAFYSSLLSIAIGLPLAYILAHRSFWGKSLITSLMMLPFVMPSVTVALGFLLMFGINGWLNEALNWAFGVRLRLLHSLWAILFAHAFYNAPLVARLTQGAWERLDPALEESARSLGAGPFAVWKDVIFPGILPGLLSGGILAFIYCFMSFPIVLTLGGARFSTLEVEIYSMIRVFLDYEMGAALAAIQAAISLIFAYVFLRIEARTQSVTSATGKRQTRPLFALSVRDLWVWPYLAFVALLFLGPIISIVVDSLKGPQGEWTMAAFAKIVSMGHDAHLGGPPLSSIGNSLSFALTAALVALITGSSFVYATVRIFRKRYPVVETMTLAPIVVSSVALAFGVLVAFRQPALAWVPQSWRIPLLHAVLAFPFVIRSFRPVLQSVDMRLVEAARTLGAKRFRAFMDVEVPVALTGLTVAFALAFGLSMSEMTATLMLARPDQVTMPVSVYRFLASRDFHTASAMAVLLMAVTTTTFLGMEFVSTYLQRRQTHDGTRAHPGRKAIWTGRRCQSPES